MKLTNALTANLVATMAIIIGLVIFILLDNKPPEKEGGEIIRNDTLILYYYNGNTNDIDSSMILGNDIILIDPVDMEEIVEPFE